MEAIILAGGFGTRLKSVVSDMPKPMAPVAGRPFLEILMAQLADRGFRRVILSLGHMAEKISNHFGARFQGMELVYEVETVPLGTGGALAAALTHCRADHVYVFNGDTYLELEVELAEAHWQNHGQPIIVGKEVSDVSRYGRLVVEGNRLMGFSEKGESGPGLINVGCYILPVDILEDMPDVKCFSLEKDYFTSAVQKRAFHVFATRGHFIDIGVPEDYHRAQSELDGRLP